MFIADYLIIFAVLLCVSVNRQSLIVLCAFALNECAYYISHDDFYFCIYSACLYASMAYAAKSVKYEIQMAFCCYSALFWFSALDYLLTPQPTEFYVIFPYVVKIIDIYVIFHLLHKEQRNVRNTIPSHCSFN